MPQIKGDDMREQLQLSFADLATFRAEALRLVLKAEEMRRPLEVMWTAMQLGELPIYEPEFRVRRVG